MTEYIPEPVLRIGDLVAMAIASLRELERKKHIKFHVTLSSSLEYALEEALDTIQHLKEYIAKLEDAVMSYEVELEEKKTDIMYFADLAKMWRNAYHEVASKYIELIMGDAIEALQIQSRHNEGGASDIHDANKG